jgi:cytochrome c oxidase subunit 4
MTQSDAPAPTPHLPAPHVPHGLPAVESFHVVNYVRIFYILVALTALTVAASFWRAPNELVNVGIALAIATIKATFVVRFFMHLKFEGKLVYTILFAPLTLAIVLIVALIPDIALGRHTAFNDMVGMFEALVGQNGR